MYRKLTSDDIEGRPTLLDMENKLARAICYWRKTGNQMPLNQAYGRLRAYAKKDFKRAYIEAVVLSDKYMHFEDKELT